MSGVASRRKAEELILQGLVAVNGKIITNLSTKIRDGIDLVTVEDKKIREHKEHIYILFNKPKDCISTAKDEKNRKTVFDYVHLKQRVFSVGRLDRNTTGVLILTNDGEFAHKLMHPSFEIKKIYNVTLDKSLESKDMKRLEGGIILDRKKTSKAEVQLFPKTHNRQFLISIHEGRNRQVRRMLEVLGYDVEKLDRVSYGDITTRGMRRGEWRYLAKQEVRHLQNLISENKNEY